MLIVFDEDQILPQVEIIKSEQVIMVLPTMTSKESETNFKRTSLMTESLVFERFEKDICVEVNKTVNMMEL
jgi:hypothetical protein